MLRQFTIRDALWLGAIIALSIGWWYHVRSVKAKHRVQRDELNAVLEIANRMKNRIDKVYDDPKSEP